MSEDDKTATVDSVIDGLGEDDPLAQPEDQVGEVADGDDSADDVVTEEDDNQGGDAGAEGQDGAGEEGEEAEAAEDGEADAETDKATDLSGERASEQVPEILRLLRQSKPKEPPGFAFEVDPRRVARRNQLIAIVRSGQQVDPALAAYLRGGQQRLQQQINESMDDPDRTVQLLAKQQEMNGLLMEHQRRSGEAVRAHAELNAMIQEDGLASLPSRERVQEITDMLVEASDGSLTADDIAMFHNLFSMGTVLQGKPIGHRFLYAFSRIAEALQTHKTIENAKATIKGKRKTEQRAGPPRAIRSGAQSGRKVKQMSTYQQRLAMAKRKGQTGDKAALDLIMTLED